VTAEEISQLDLKGTELVVISACQSGLGALRTGEGVSGLRRAFTYAGAQTLVMSLYEVPDVETQLLMTDFYENLKTGATQQASLRNAQLTMIAQRRAEYGAAHPYYWGSFILIGRPE
jgi:CHAT domain-containing protein